MLDFLKSGFASIGHSIWACIFGYSYIVAMLLGTAFIIAYIVGWKKGLNASIITLFGYAVMVLLNGVF
ncbi:MAG: hypothetical protein Q8936_01595 [Bacillota bacterium]|nr:hypothetical protein [Bacillota bacterium]